MKKEHRRFKRGLSLLVTVTMLAGLISVPQPGKVEAADNKTELIENGGFDTTADWTNNSDSSNPTAVAEQKTSTIMVPNYVACQDFENASDYDGKWRNQGNNGKGGKGSLELVAEPGNEENHVLEYTVTDLNEGAATFDFNNGDVQIFEKGKTYTLFYRYKSTASFHGYHANIDSGWMTYGAGMAASTEWKEVSVTFTPNDSLKTFQIGFQLLGDGTFYLDDFSISCGETEKVTETVHQVFTADFEQDADRTKVQSNPGTFAIDTTEKKSGTGSLKLGFTSAWSQFGIGTFELKAGTEYTISYDWKIADYTKVDKTQNAYSRLVKTSDTWTALNTLNFQTSETDWTTVTYSYTPTEDITAAIYMEVGGGTATMWVDNLSISYKTSKTELAFSEGIGTCAGAEPDNVLVMEQMTEVTYPVTITAGTTYQYSFAVKQEAVKSDFACSFGAGENVIWNGAQKDTEWTTVSGIFTAETDASEIRFTRTGTGKVYLDDVSLMEVEVAENAISNGGFDTTANWTNNSDSSNPTAVAEQQTSTIMVPNYVAYQDFENDSEYEGKWRNQGNDGKGGKGSLEFVADPEDAENHVLKYTVTGLSSGAATFDFNNGDVQIFEKGQTYTLSYRYKSTVSFHGYHANIDSVWTTYGNGMAASTEWKEVSVTFTPNDSLTTFQIGFQLLGNGTFYLDDFSVSCGETEKVTETVHQVFTADFEQEEDRNKVQAAPNKLWSIDTTEKKSGTGSLKVDFGTAWGQLGIGNFELEAGTEYTISYDWKIQDYKQVVEEQNAYSRLVKTSDTWTALNTLNFQTSETDWTTVTYSYTPTEDITAAIYMEVGGGTATMWVDNLSVSYKTSKTELAFSEGIGTCADAEPDNVLVMEQMTEVTYPVTITAGTTYQYSFAVKQEAVKSDFACSFGAGENVIWNGAQKDTEWTTVSGIFIAETDASAICFTRTGTGKVYLDDVSLCEVTGASGVAEINVTKAYPLEDNSWYLEVDDISKATSSYYNMDVLVDGVRRTVAVGIDNGKFIIWNNFFSIIDTTASVPKSSFIIPKGTILRPIDPDNTGWKQEIEADRLKIAARVEVHSLGAGWAVYSKIKDSSATPVYYNIDSGTYLVASSGGAYAIQKDGVDITGTELTTVGTYDITRVEQDTKFVQEVVLYKTGDTNGDNQVDARDIIATKKLLAGNTAQNLAGGYAADMNRSGTVDSTDMRALRYSLLYDTAFMTKGDSVLNGVMPIMGYDGPDIIEERGTAGYEEDFITADIFQKIEDVGINMIVADRNEIGESNEISERMLQLAEANNLKVYLQNGYVNDPDNQEGIVANAAQFAKQTAKYSGYASFAGYYITDEPTNTKLAKYKTAMKAIEPYTNVHGYLNLFPYISVDLNKDMGGTENESTSETNYLKYLENASAYGAQTLSYDLYLRGNGTASGLFGMSTTYKIHTEDFYTNLDWARTASQEEGKPFYAFVQVGTDFGKDIKKTDQKNLTTVQEMYLEASAALAMGARGLSYYSVVQPFEYAKTSKDGTYDVYRSGLINTEGKENNGAGGDNYKYYDAAKKINSYIAMVDEVLMYASSKGAVTNNATIKGYIDNAAINATDEKAGVLKSVTGSNALVGCFDYYGKDAYMVVNTSTSASEAMVLTFDTAQNIKQIQMGEADWTSNDSVSAVTLNLGAGESALVVIE